MRAIRNHVLVGVACLVAIGVATREAHALTSSQEKDEILSLLGYSIAYAGWQTGLAPARGYNVASVLVDPYGDIVFWGRNCVTQQSDITRHADVVAMEKYLDTQAGLRYLSSYSLYSTLDPCVQCAGMAIMGYLSRVVYGLTDARSGQVLQIYLNAGKSFSIPTPVAAPTSYRTQLEDAFRQTGESSIEDWLFSTTAKNIFQAAHDRLAYEYKVQYSQNSTVLDQARQVLRDVEARSPSVCSQ